MTTLLRNIIIGKKEPSQKSTFFWTVLSGTLYSTISFFLLIIVTRISGNDETGGVFSISFAIAQQLLTVGCYSMRAFQSSDLKSNYSFSEYLSSRAITCIVMMIAGAVWVLIAGYSPEKAAVVLLFCLLKMLESVSDIFEGLYQQKDRFDVSGKSLALKSFLTIAVFAVVFWFTKNLVISAAVLCVIIFISICLFDLPVVGYFDKLRISFDFKRVFRLLWDCFPLFLGMFLSIYLNNCAKYAIDANLSDRLQTYFNILYMPAFVINMFGGFILKPQLTVLSKHYINNDFKKFFVVLRNQIIYLMLLTVVCVTGGALLGLPVLSWLYGVNLDGYLIPLVILLIAGGFSSVSIAISYALTVMRYQFCVLISYAVTVGVALFLMPAAVKAFGITGAAVGYLSLMILMSAVMAVFLIVFINKQKKTTTKENQ